ncbi:hypothetical protein DP939_22380 [Spongiactinospora rosea]|uniref:NlpC/P60 domain-containing protein n=2 Tax=Spongiactinospora rosea TaxID=2248750 RepID=A0A366LW21_9ACTN|nr:hypothetical protein DP939_22380 [Spongiactinospora rosea]
MANAQAIIDAANSLGLPREAAIIGLATALQESAQDETTISDHGWGPQAHAIITMLSTRSKTANAAATTPCSSQASDTLADPTSGRGAIAVRAALTMLGVPYSWGGGGPAGPTYGIGRGARTLGFDCSGLTEYAWAQAGVRIGTTTYEQWRAGSPVPKSRITPGDLVFYETDPTRPGPDHVGLAISATHMVNAPHTGAVVRVDIIERAGYLGAGRL